MLVRLRQVFIVVSIIVLLLAMTSILSERLYFLMRFIVSITAVFLAYQAKILRKNAWIYTMLAVVILFNPVLPLRFNRVDFVLVNLITACLLTASLVKIKKEEDPPRLNKKLINIILVSLFFLVIISIVLYSYILTSKSSL